MKACWERGKSKKAKKKRKTKWNLIECINDKNKTQNKGECMDNWWVKDQ